MVRLFPEAERVPLLLELLERTGPTYGWPSMLERAGFEHALIAQLIYQRIIDHASAEDFLLCITDGMWRFFRGKEFEAIIKRCARYNPERVCESRDAIEKYVLEYDPETGEYAPVQPEARAIMRSIMCQGLTSLFEELEANK